MKTMLKRGAGILMPIFSLPSPYGIGTFGSSAYEFIDLLRQARQNYWQVLPMGPTSYGDSPYQSFSAFAGNPYFIDLDMLKEEELLTQEEIDACFWLDKQEEVKDVYKRQTAACIGSVLKIVVALFDRRHESTVIGIQIKVMVPERIILIRAMKMKLLPFL